MTKKKKMLEDMTETLGMNKFLNIAPIEQCYHRLFEEPFKRIGYATELLADFL